ncbi:MAG: S41 family peptidase [Candidatus Heimdallarchaeota archaeon]|nr:S41 family peptidase [Candidatus Heimdallarchaeota archaeon]
MAHLQTEKIKEIIEQLSTEIKNNYVFPEIANELVEKLHQNTNNYLQITHARKLEQIITKDLQQWSNDKHFYFEYNPKEAHLGEERGEYQISDEELKIGYHHNYFIRKVECLPGNIGYILINDFFQLEHSGDPIFHALQFLSTTEAIILDVRYNGGGDSDVIQFLISYFLEPKAILLETFSEPRKNREQQLYSLSYVVGRRFPKKPIYILTSSRSASAAEHLAYDLKNLQRASIIGEQTKGAANFPDVIPIAHTFLLWLPIGRPINPHTNGNWEGIGVEPDIKINQDRALYIAHKTAIQEIMKDKSVNETQEQLLHFDTELIEAIYNPVSPKVSDELLGKYGSWSVVSKNKGLYFNYNNIDLEMITHDNIQFFVNEMFRIRFTTTNDTVSVELFNKMMLRETSIHKD